MWRELIRTDDLDEALTIVTTIAAMEFDVRWLSFDAPGTPGAPGALGSCDLVRCESDFGGPPYIIEVAPDQWHDLRDVLAELREEQWEFDRRVETSRGNRDRVVVGVTVVLSVAPIVISIIDLLDGR